MVTTNLPRPDFTFDPNQPGACIAGVRPYRNGSYRLETETDSQKFIVHNYGHAGAGITLSFGCATKVREIVKDHLASSAGSTEVAVLGAGVIGLTAATLLLDLGLKVTLYSDRAPMETTSAKAGGQWAVSVVEFAGKERELAEILTAAYREFKSRIGQGFGVVERPNYTATPSHNLDIVIKIAPGLIPPRQSLPRLPFEHHTKPGFVYQTLLIEPPALLGKLKVDLDRRGVAFVTKPFVSRSDVLANVPQNIIINCTGLGALSLWSDPKVTPIKGQLAMLPPQPALQYLYGQDGYMFPRSDHVVIGGTFEVGTNNERPNKAVCQGLVRHIASLFGQAPVRPLPDIHIHNPLHAPIVNPRIPEV